MRVHQALFVLCLSVLCTNSVSAGVIDLTIRAMIDGRDRLVLQGSTARWHHFDYAAVGRHDGLDEPTYFSMDLNGTRVMDDVRWTPSWSTSAPDEIRREEWSSTFLGLAVKLPSEPQTLTLTNVQVRGTASIVSNPTDTNQYTTIIEFDDNPTGAHDWYEIRLSYSFQSVPTPATILIPLTALLIRRRRA